MLFQDHEIYSQIRMQNTNLKFVACNIMVKTFPVVPKVEATQLYSSSYNRSRIPKPYLSLFYGQWLLQSPQK